MSVRPNLIERLRVERGLSYDRLGEIAGVGADTASRYARGLVSRPRILTLRKLAQALEADVWELLHEYTKEVTDA